MFIVGVEASPSEIESAWPRREPRGRDSTTAVVPVTFARMTIRAKHSRAITVDGERLRWWYRLPFCGNPDCPQDWGHVVIVHASRTGALVKASVPPFSGAITPEDIARIARNALARGWIPGHGSGEFHFRAAT